MKMLWEGKSGLAKATAILTAILLVSLGLCGANIVAFIGFNSNLQSSLIVTAYLELAGMVFSALGLAVVGIIAIVRAVIRRSPTQNSEKES